MVKKLIGALVVLVVVVGAGVWWFVLRDDPPAELSVNSGTDSGEDTSTTGGPAPDSLDGTWTVVTGGDTTAGFRIDEEFARGAASHTAVGRSDEVSGDLTIAGDQVTDGSFTVDLTELEFTDDPGLPVANRKRAISDRGIETDRFPEASLTITEPIDFGGMPADGQTVNAEVTGELTLHGVTNPVTFEIEAELVGASIRVATADPVPVVLADYDIEAPTGGPVASVSDEGSFEFLVVLEQS